ncbi:MAG TPA: hypothetical protein VFF69_15130 [Phycisphaerales bacterium]|nr:hypothetical protein [Phycisphaerales bacterium]
MMGKSRMLTACLVSAGVVIPSLAQVAPPPPGKPEPTPEFRPPPPPPPRRPVNRPVAAPPVDFEPISRRDDAGKIVRISEPVEYVAMSHNPLIDVALLAKMAPYLYERRQRVESHVIENLDAIAGVEQGVIESTRMSDEENLRATTGRLMALTSTPDLKQFLSLELMEDGVIPPAVGALTQKIMESYQKDLTTEAMAAPVEEGGASPIDQMMHAVVRMSLSEFEYFYRELMMDTADHFGAVLPELGLDAETSAKVKPLADRLAAENDLDARASLIREIFAAMPEAARERAMRLAIERRPEVDPQSLMAPLPEGATAKEIDNETRHEIIFQILDGGRVDTSAFVE